MKNFIKQNKIVVAVVMIAIIVLLVVLSRESQEKMITKCQARGNSYSQCMGLFK